MLSSVYLYPTTLMEITMEEQRKNYNLLSLNGYEDEHFVETYGMPKDLAGTPEMNIWMTDYTYKMNVKQSMKDGSTRKVAEEEANVLRAEMADKIDAISYARGY